MKKTIDRVYVIYFLYLIKIVLSYVRGCVARSRRTVMPFFFTQETYETIRWFLLFRFLILWSRLTRRLRHKRQVSCRCDTVRCQSYIIYVRLSVFDLRVVKQQCHRIDGWFLLFYLCYYLSKSSILFVFRVCLIDVPNHPYISLRKYRSYFVPNTKESFYRPFDNYRD